MTNEAEKGKKRKEMKNLTVIVKSEIDVNEMKLI